MCRDSRDKANRFSQLVEGINSCMSFQNVAQSSLFFQPKTQESDGDMMVGTCELLMLHYRGTGDDLQWTGLQVIDEIAESWAASSTLEAF